jgi:hypothetical protein
MRAALAGALQNLETPREPPPENQERQPTRPRPAGRRRRACHSSAEPVRATRLAGIQVPGSRSISERLVSGR